MSEAIRWLGTTEAAERLGVVPRTLYRMIDEGAIPAYKMGRVIRVKESDLDAFLEGTRVQPGSLSHLYPERVESED
jgi:excisionase family DNA binding protein